MKPHLCEQPMNLTKRACCQLVLFLNDTERVPPCTPSMFPPSTSHKPPVYLVEPMDEREDHFTFFVGIFMLMCIALACSIGLSKITKPKVSIGYNASNSSYDILMWLSSDRASRSSMLLLLRSIACRTIPQTPDSTQVSVVSSNIPLLPSYQSATTRTTTSSISTTSTTPPPPYSATTPLVA